MMMRFSRLLTALVAVGAMIVLSCGGDETIDPVGTGDPQIGIKLLAGECNTEGAGDYIDGSNIADRLGSLAIQFYTEGGTIVKVNGKNAVSLTRAQLSESVEITGIPNLTNARVVFSGFEEGNISSPKWRGTVRNVDFAKGKTTSVTVVLYPVAGMGCFPKTLAVPRFGHTVTELPDGRILIAGGFTETANGIWQATDSVELLDPESGTIDQLTDMLGSRAFHFAVALPDGRVLFTGGVLQMETKKMAVTGYPDMPFTLSYQANGVELYTVKLLKVNQRAANAIDESESVFIDMTDDKFFPFQSYAYARSNDETGAGTIFMAGGVKDGAAQTTIYGIDIVIGDDSTVTATINTLHTDKDPLVAPLVAAAGTDRVLVIGGHKSSSIKFGHIVSTGTYEDWTGTAPNLFFGSITADLANDVIVAASGLELPKDANEFSMNGRSYKFSPQFSSQSDGPLFWGTWLHDMVLNGAEGYFTVIGGTGNFDITAENVAGNNFLEYVSLETMDFTSNEAYDYFKVPRVLHRTVVTADQMLYIVGGIQDLKGTALVGTIELLQMKKPF